MINCGCPLYRELNKTGTDSRYLFKENWLYYWTSRTCRWLNVNTVSPKVEVVRQTTSVISNHVAFICVLYWVKCCTLHLFLKEIYPSYTFLNFWRKSITLRRIPYPSVETCYRFLLPLPAGYIFCSFFDRVYALTWCSFCCVLGMGLT